MKKDWLWDKNLSEKQTKDILHNPKHSRFISLASLLLARKNIPQEVFRFYLEPKEFCRNWKAIKKNMRKDAWNNPRIEFWQAVYEKLLEKYQAEGINIFPESIIKPINDFCLRVGERIKVLRKEKGLTQKMLAKNLNISQQMISRIESGKENISLITLKKIIDVLGANIFIK